MNSDLAVRPLLPQEETFISQIANWYFDEWQTPIENTIQRLTNPSENDLLFQLIMMKGEELIATGGIAWDVNIVRVIPEFKIYGPWLALLFTAKKYRKQGFGERLLRDIELKSSELDLNKIYLSTHSAESLYKRCGWQEVERVNYKNKDAVIMCKRLV